MSHKWISDGEDSRDWYFKCSVCNLLMSISKSKFESQPILYSLPGSNKYMGLDSEPVCSEVLMREALE